MNRYIVYVILIAYGWTNINAQNSNLIVNGFSKYIAGVEENEDCSYTPDATVAMTVRCINEKESIEWETSPIPENYNGKTVSFIWSGGYSTGNQFEARSFSLYDDDKFLISFITASRITGGDWEVENDSTRLTYKNYKFYDRSGNKKDFWGLFILTIPTSQLSDNRTLKIKIKGDASGSRHWCRAMKYQLLPKIKINDEKIVSKDEAGRLTQRIKISIDHYSYPEPVEIFAENKKVVSGNLNLGTNDFYIRFDAIKTRVQKTLEIKINGQSTLEQVTISPVKNLTFYLLAHSHVDLGYTDLQPVIEKKQWRNIEEALKLSEQTMGNSTGSVFKWNTEVLWAVKSYLERFPEKRREFFNAVKKGWIGLDATYGNLLTGLSRPEELYKWAEYSNQLEKEEGIKIESAMISDVPGFSWGIVQALTDNGVKYISVGPNESDRIGDLLNTWGDKPFYWQSQSGKSKLLVWIAGKGYSWFHHWSLTKGNISPLMKYIDDLEVKNYPYDIVQLRYTIGDNGGPDSSLPAFVEEWNRTHITPLFKLATTDEMFKEFEKEYGSLIPTYKGDLTPYWEDGAASSSKETALNRNTSELLSQMETLYTLDNSKEFPQSDFDEAWKNVLLYSEHTWGAYNSISEPEDKLVIEEWRIKKSFAVKADSIVNKLFNGIRFSENSQNDPVEYLTVLNSNSWIRSDVVTIPAGIKTIGEYLLDDSGKQIAAQRLTTGEFVFIAKNISPFSSRQFRFVNTDPGQIKPFSKSPDKNKLINEVFSKEIDSFIDKSFMYGFNEFVHTGKNANNPQSNDSAQIIQGENGPVVNSVVSESGAPGCNKLIREVRTYCGLDKTEIINTIHKKKIYDKENLRFVFPFNVENPITRIDIAWSVIRPEADQMAAANKNYFTVQRWVDVSNENRGITVATIDAPLIEIGGMTAEEWTASPLKIWKNKTNSSSKIFSWVMNNSWHTNYKAEQEGVASFRYVLQSHKKFDYSKAYRFGVEQSQPMLFTNSENSINIEQIVSLDQNSTIVVTSLKPSRDGRGLIVRLYNPTDNTSKTALKTAKKYSKLYLSSGDEEETKPIDNKLIFAPFEVKTIKAINK